MADPKYTPIKWLAIMLAWGLVIVSSATALLGRRLIDWAEPEAARDHAARKI